MIDGSVLQSAQRCFEKKSRVVVKMVVRTFQAQIAKKIRTFGSGSASAKKK